MEEVIDKRLEALRSKAVSRYEKIISDWEDVLARTGTWFETKRVEFEAYAKLNIQQCTKSSEYDEHSGCSNGRILTFLSHHCGQKCRLDECLVTREQWFSVSPLSVPLLMGWERIEVQQSAADFNGPISVFYVAPCKRRLRSMEEVEGYLFSVGMDTGQFGLKISQFSFDPLVVVRSYVYDSKEAGAKVFISDISKGLEARPVMCVNENDEEMPVEFEYIAQHTAERVMCKDDGFLVSCSCVDNCTNRSKCECWQLTMEESKALGQEPRHSVGYVHHRLKREQYSGIYECNARCSCGPRCSNRVVQRGLQHRMQVFKTRDRGWGLRSLDDIPKGTFVCTYIGHVYSEEVGNELGTRDGDEYQAELDYIEVMEHRKEGYESDVVCSSEEDSEDPLSDSVSAYSVQSVASTRLRLRRSSSHCSALLDSLSSGEEEQSVVGSFLDDLTTPSMVSAKTLAADVTTRSSEGSSNKSLTTDLQAASVGSSLSSCSPCPPRTLHMRHYFQEDHTYVMDAKRRGNLGRYINHSCSPNLFVQNVFIDTHDLRFPWVAFFARKRIKAMQELTWDYNYVVGSVEGKRIDCRCGAINCRKRLL
eukprot:Em0015g1268a